MNSRRQAPPSPSPDEIDSLIVDGLKAHHAGDLAKAAELYGRALQARPDHADALNLAGACAFAQGQTEAAIRLISRAILALPTHFDAYMNLAEALAHAGRAREAADTCRRALIAKPDFVDAHARLAGLLAEQNAFDQALAHARVALALAPDTVEALCARALVLRRRQKFVEADAAYARALDIAPEDVRALTGRAALLAQVDRTEEAAALYRRALAITPDDAEVVASLGSVVERGGDPKGALALYDQALAIEPGSADILHRRASAIRDTGDFDSAEAGYRHALSADRNHAPSILALVRLKRLDFDAARGKHLARLLADPAQPATHRVQAGFALADLLDRAGDTDAAFSRYAEANRLHEKAHADRGERFDPAELRAGVEQAEARFAQEYARDTAGWGSPTDTPVFVVGMPRSGTTLVEQICASHSEVAGAGELGAIMNAGRAIAAHNEGRDTIADWDPAFARAVADRHAEALARLGKGARRVVDKSPLNLMRLGLIGALYPEARVIWCHRDPRDVIISNYTLYLGQGNLHATDLRHCAYALRQIERLGAAWVRHGKLAVLHVVYEDLVADLDTHVRRIIDFLEVGWEPGCLDFHKTDRRVDTPSSWQVRQPIYTSSIGRWRRYEKHLGPMFEALAAPL